MESFQLIKIACQTAALTTIAVIVVLVLAVALPGTAMRNLYFAILHPMPSIYTISFVWCLDSLENLRHHAAWQKGMFGVTGSGIASSQICTACGQWLPQDLAKQSPQIASDAFETPARCGDVEKDAGPEYMESGKRTQDSSHALLDFHDALMCEAVSSERSRTLQSESHIGLAIRRASLFRPSEATLR